MFTYFFSDARTGQEVLVGSTSGRERTRAAVVGDIGTSDRSAGAAGGKAEPDAAEMQLQHQEQVEESEMNMMQRWNSSSAIPKPELSGVLSTTSFATARSSLAPPILPSQQSTYDRSRYNKMSSPHIMKLNEERLKRRNSATGQIEETYSTTTGAKATSGKDVDSTGEVSLRTKVNNIAEEAAKLWESRD